MAKIKATLVPTLNQTWTLSPVATMGSAVRAKGILMELRAKLPWPIRKQLDIGGMTLILTLPEEDEEEFEAGCATVTNALKTMESLPILPREIEDILTISTTERRRWLDDGRLPSGGIRTVRLRGRAKRITFHVFDPRIVEDILNSGIVDEWREHDLVTKAENRRRAAHQAKLTRSLKKAGSNRASNRSSSELSGWADFDKDGLLR
ncbi:hypothetical protein [Rhizobium sp. Leaf262]|uniref:hypothetical protein n=1 Tax=Rhizobium sp. Leaf262 TaxID=1736312 RepID=UPI000712EA52|nr:hypothetical protein [Rhizobium sp. Leaf262]KQO83841.1 hypothetical protein ASF29_03355 [Rhizobium sp. Leaf262]